MQCVFQLIELTGGTRSAPVNCDRKIYANQIAENVPEEFHDSHAVIALLEQKQGEWEFSRAPYMLVSTFIQQFKEASDNG